MEEDEQVQAKFAAGPAPVQAARDDLSPQPRSGMPARLKSGIERLSGVSLDGVQVHYDSARPAQLQALAYTQGKDIHVGPGQEHHLAHEAWHVVQQRQGRVKPTTSQNGASINDDPGLEKEADRMGAKASRWKGNPPAEFTA
jgi:hypothetical protein